MIFKFSILSPEAEDFLLDVELPYDLTLLDFNDLLLKTLQYNPSEMTSFFKSDIDWEKFQEFTLFDMGLELDPDDFEDYDDDEKPQSPIAMGDALLGKHITEKFDRLIYVFDMFNERELYIELIETKFPDESATYPRVVELKGTPPKQIN